MLTVRVKCIFTSQNFQRYERVRSEKQRQPENFENRYFYRWYVSLVTTLLSAGIFLFTHCQLNTETRYIQLSVSEAFYLLLILEFFRKNANEKKQSVVPRSFVILIKWQTFQIFISTRLLQRLFDCRYKLLRDIEETVITPTHVKKFLITNFSYRYSRLWEYDYTVRCYEMYTTRCHNSYKLSINDTFGKWYKVD